MLEIIVLVLKVIFAVALIGVTISHGAAGAITLIVILGVFVFPFLR